MRFRCQRVVDVGKSSSDATARRIKPAPHRERSVAAKFVVRLLMLGLHHATNAASELRHDRACGQIVQVDRPSRRSGQNVFGGVRQLREHLSKHSGHVNRRHAFFGLWEGCVFPPNGPLHTNLCPGPRVGIRTAFDKLSPVLAPNTVYRNSFPIHRFLGFPPLRWMREHPAPSQFSRTYVERRFGSDGNIC